MRARYRKPKRRRGGSMGWNAAIAAVVIVGVVLIVFTLQSNDKSGAGTGPPHAANATTGEPGYHWHTYLGVDICGEFLAPQQVFDQPVGAPAGTQNAGIHTHGDGLIHIHPFTDSVAGRNATMGVFLDQVGVSMTNDTLTLPSGQIYKEGTTKCQDGRDGQLQIAKWNNVADAAQGKKPNEIFTDGFDQIRLGANESFTIAFMPAGSTIPAKPDVATRIANVSDLQPSTTAPASGAPGSSTPTTGTVPGASGAPDTTPNTAPTSAPDTATTVPATSSP
jgi:hypothetical protein